jgi:hypothetical protein
MAQVAGTVRLPLVTGAVVGGFASTDGESPEIAYRAAFVVIGPGVALALIACRRAPEVTALASRTGSGAC